MSAFFNSMAGRVFFILVGGILASAALTLFLANRERQEFVNHIRTYHASERMIQIVTMLEASPPGTWQPTLAALSKNGLVAEFPATAPMQGAPEPLLTARMQERLGPDHKVLAVRGECLPQIALAATHSPRVPLCLSAFITLRDGKALHLTLPPQPERASYQTIPHWLLYGLMFAASLGLFAYWVTRMATRPLRLLATAAAGLGNNIENPPLAEAGPTEVREAASAFNQMQAQIKDFVQERTHLLAAITHDLQTPLTRLRLRLEKVPDDELRARLIGDMSAIQDMIRNGLDLARSMNASGEAIQRIDFDSLLNSLCDDAVEAGQDVTLEGTTYASITASPEAIRRCLTNLLDNAVKYGAYARIKAKRGAENIVVRIRDGGPGIPEAQLEKVFTPFFRLEESRSRETGGTGIGLAIARNIAEQYGGTLFLHNHLQGGLEAVLELPLV